MATYFPQPSVEGHDSAFQNGPTRSSPDITVEKETITPSLMASGMTDLTSLPFRTTDKGTIPYLPKREKGSGQRSEPDNPTQAMPLGAHANKPLFLNVSVMWGKRGGLDEHLSMPLGGQV